MSDEKNSKPKAVYKPGELQETRKHLGELTPEESMRIAKMLGGEVGIEQAPAFEESIKALKNSNKRPSFQKVPVSGNFQARKTHSNSKKNSQIKQAKTAKKQITKIPALNSKEKANFDKLMANPDYKIKKKPNFIARLFSFGKSSEKLSAEFVSVLLLDYVLHMQKFFVSVNAISNCASKEYAEKIQNGTSPKFRFLNSCKSYDASKINEMQISLAGNPKNVSVYDIIPLIKEIYKTLLTLFFLGETGVKDLIKIAFSEITVDPKIEREEYENYMRTACSEWEYIYKTVFKKLYPLLMRMTSNEVLPFARFFNKNMPKILTFTELTKFDLILPDKQESDEPVTSTNVQPQTQDENTEETEAPENNESTVEEKIEEDENEPAEEDSTEESKNEKIDDDRPYVYPINIGKSLDLLEKLFPEAGWFNIHKGNDFYPYFQTIYHFPEGFNLLSPTNPMQPVIILLRILEDFFQGCRNMKFTLEKVPGFIPSYDSMSKALSEWSLYREYVFEKIYLFKLKNYVNQAYGQSDFLKSSYSKKEMSSILWCAKEMFLPYLNYEFLLTEKKEDYEISITLSKRVQYLKNSLMSIISRAEKAGAENLRGESPDDHEKEESIGCANILSHYKFEISNPVSERIDSLFGGSNNPKGTNLILLKYILCILNVLNWWINDKNSPAYDMYVKVPYRVNPKDGSILLYVETRNDQIQLFNKAKKERAEKHARELAKNNGNNPNPAT